MQTSPKPLASPRSKSAATKPPPSGRTRGTGAGLSTFLLGTALTTLAFAWSVDVQQQAIRRDVTHRSDLVTTGLARELARQRERLEAFAALVRLSPGGTRDALRAILPRTSSGGLAVDWVPRVPADGKKAFEEAQWLQGAPEYRLRRSDNSGPPLREHFPLLFGISSEIRANGLDLSAGFDLASVESLSPTLQAARDGSTSVSTSTVSVVTSEGKGFAAIFLAPVLVSETASGTTSLVGFIFGILPLESLLQAAVSDQDRYDLSMELRDVAGSTLLSHQAARGEISQALVVFWNLLGIGLPERDTSVQLSDQIWTLQTTAGLRLVTSHLTWTPWLIALLGLLLTVVATVATYAHLAREVSLAEVNRRLSSERRDSQQKLGALADDLDREKRDRRRTEQNLFREKQQFRLMFNAVPAMVFYKDTKNRFLLVNEAAAASLGKSVEEVEGKPCSEIIPSKAYELYRDDLDIIQTSKSKTGLIEEMPLPDGRTIWARTDKLPEYDSMGRVVGILVFSQDITDHRRAEDEVLRLNAELEARVTARTVELKAANQELESFAYSVSHDLRTPLRIMDGFSKLVLEEYAPMLPAPAQDYLQRLRGSAQRMGRQLEDLLQLTRLSRAEFRPQDVDLSGLARDVVAGLKQSTPDRRMDVVIEATPFARGDRDLLARVLENLLENAWKFTRPTPEPRIEFGSTTLAEDRTAFYVRDNGVGFDMVYATRLFDPFQRLHSQEEFEGTGMGLAIVRLIVRRHSGEVWTESVAGKGTTIFFTLGA